MKTARNRRTTKPEPVRFDEDGARFITDERAVACAIGLDDVLAAVVALLAAQRSGCVATPARLYLVDAQTGRVAMYDCEKPWIYISWVDFLMVSSGWDRPIGMFDLKPWDRVFTFPEQAV